MTDELLVGAGTLLAAWPDLLDPNFMHSVVAICQHSTEGAYGVVVNRATKLKIRDLLSDHPVLGGLDFPVHLGGPVDHSTVQFLHTVPDRIPGGFCLDGTLWLGGELEAAARFLAAEGAKAERSLRVFLGYSGWGAGQLEAELQAGSWLPAPLSLDAVFGEVGEATWRRVVRSVGKEGQALERLPPDVSWN
ncbi:MAG: YqgE/AlgH family protein [Planctomycetota bacterium]